MTNIDTRCPERYLPLPCPNCNRWRLLYSPVDSQLRCEKCGADTDTLAFHAEDNYRLRESFKRARELLDAIYLKILRDMPGFRPDIFVAIEIYLQSEVELKGKGLSLPN